MKIFRENLIVSITIYDDYKFTALGETSHHSLIFSDLGNGWRPAYFENRHEQDYIKQGQKTLRNSAPYWINGSALYDPSVILIPGEDILIPGPPTIIYAPQIGIPNPDYNANTSGSIFYLSNFL